MTRLILLVLFAASSAAAANEPTVHAELDAFLLARMDTFIDMRRDLHRHAESAGNEVRTAGIVADRLDSLGLQVQRGVGGHGVVAVLEGAHPGPVVAYRADMDAMATPAGDTEEFRSIDPGVNHVCGHDIHTTVGLAVAEALVRHRTALHGTVKFIFQPAEEIATGAKAMIDDGALDSPTPDLFLALHCAPVPVGQLLLLEGMALPGLEMIRVRCSGTGDLEAATTPIVNAFLGITNTGSPMGTDLNALVWPPERPYRVGSVISADPDPGTGDLVVTGFVKASDEASYAESRRMLAAAIAEISVENVELEISFEGMALPAMVNDIELGKRTTRLARQMLGDANVQSMPGSVPFFGEDFSYFQQKAPGVLYFLGVANAEKGINGMPHAPDFRADEDAILVGARAMTSVILGLGTE